MRMQGEKGTVIGGKYITILSGTDMKSNKDENWRTFIDLASNMAYNGIAYEIKRFAQRNLLVGKSLAKSMHQDADTS